MAFTQTRLVEALGVTPETADQILGIIRGSIEPETVDRTADWVRQCFNRPSAIELKIHAIDVLLENYGCESIWGEGSAMWPAAEYSNNGDTYAATILYDYVANKWRLTSWGTFFEHFETRYGLK